MPQPLASSGDHTVKYVLTPYLLVLEAESILRWDPGEPPTWLLPFSRYLYLGWCRSQPRRASHASCCIPVLVRLTATAISACRLLGCSSRHLQAELGEGQFYRTARQANTHYPWPPWITATWPLIIREPGQGEPLHSRLRTQPLQQNTSAGMMRLSRKWFP